MKHRVGQVVSVRQSIGFNPPNVTHGLSSPKWDGPLSGQLGLPQMRCILRWAQVKHPNLYHAYIKADSGMHHSLAKSGRYKAQAADMIALWGKLEEKYKSEAAE